MSVDQRLERWVVAHRAEPFDTIFVALSHIGSFGIVWFVLAVTATLLLRRPLIFPLVVTAYFLSAAITDVLKLSIDRHRPADDPLVVLPTSHSFPSGHAATSFACAGTLAPFVSRRGQIVLYVLAAGIAYSRVYVGVHYPLDVIGGAAIGYGVAIALRRLPAALRRSRRSPRAD
ncbi:MAG: phosphatase PAP2 family protein [Gaiellaceae bacterium]